MDKKIYRIIDANLNRAREGLRVIEDYARFILNDDKLTRKLKRMRQDLAGLSQKVYPELISARASEKDVGAEIREGKRKNLKALTIANFKRIQESIRVLEEFSKLLSSEAGEKFKKLRFRIYVLEKQFYEKTPSQK